MTESTLPLKLAELTRHVRDNFTSMKHVTFGCKPSDESKTRWWVFISNRGEKKFIDFDGKNTPLPETTLLPWVEGVLYGFGMACGVLEGERQAVTDMLLGVE